RKGAHHLEGAADAEAADAVGLAAEHIPALEGDRAAVAPQEAVEQVEERRLAGAVGADDAEDLALADGESHLLHRAQSTEGLGEIADDEDRLAGAGGSGVRRLGRGLRPSRRRWRRPPPSEAAVAQPPEQPFRRQQDDEDDGEAEDDALDARQYIAEPR